MCSNCRRTSRPDENANDDWRAESDGVGELHVFCPDRAGVAQQPHLGDAIVDAGAPCVAPVLVREQALALVRPGQLEAATCNRSSPSSPPIPAAVHQSSPAGASSKAEFGGVCGS